MQYIYHAITALFLSITLLGCTAAGRFGGSKKQLEAVNQRLERYKLGNVVAACDGCNFLMQEEISSQNNTINPTSNTLSRAKSGVRVYILEKVSLEDAFIMLLDSNIFARRINKNYKEALIELIKNGGKDFNQTDNERQMEYQAFSSLSFAKRLKSPNSEPKAQLDSIDTIDGDNGSWRYTDSLEAFILDDEIIIIHYYSQNEIWTK